MFGNTDAKGLEYASARTFCPHCHLTSFAYACRKSYGEFPLKKSYRKGYWGIFLLQVLAKLLRKLFVAKAHFGGASLLAVILFTRAKEIRTSPQRFCVAPKKSFCPRASAKVSQHLHYTFSESLQELAPSWARTYTFCQSNSAKLPSRGMSNSVSPYGHASFPAEVLLLAGSPYCRSLPAEVCQGEFPKLPAKMRAEF